MRRWLIYLTIYSLFFGLSAWAVIYLSEPSSVWLVWGWLILVGLTVFCVSSLILCIIQSMRPDHKLPDLLVKGTLFQSGLIAVGVVGVLALRWWNGGLLQIILWCIILLSSEWLIRSRQIKVDSDDQTKVYMSRTKRHSRK